MRPLGPALAAALAILPLAPFAAAQDGPLRLSMESAAAIALEKNTELAIARMEERTARQRRKEAFGAALPDLDVSANYTYQGNVQEVEFGGMSFQFQPDHLYTADARLSQYVYSGAVAAGYRAAGHMSAAAEKSAAAARNDILTEVKTRMYGAIHARRVIEARQEAVEQLRAHLEDSRDREEVGLNTSYDTMRFETQLAQARAELVAARNEHSRAVSALLDSLGLSPLEDVVIEAGLESDPPRVSLDEAIARAEANRPEIIAARESQRAAEETASAVESELLPTVKAVGTYRYSNMAVALDGQSEWRSDWSVGLALEYNLFDGRERASRIARRRLEEDMARLRAEKTVRGVLMEVKTAWEELERAREFAASQRENVGYAEQTYRIAAERREEGMGTRLELLDAQLALTNARINQSRSLYEVSLAGARLERAMGVVEVDR
ncbi:MAG: TolC family protein [Candidatus Nitrospinota bacterium M3_3B_026]